MLLLNIYFHDVNMYIRSSGMKNSKQTQKERKKERKKETNKQTNKCIYELLTIIRNRHTCKIY